jgi:ABC-type multidrug transport system ATPase subunit
MTVMDGSVNGQLPTAAASDMIVCIDGLSKRYGRTVALDGVSLAIRRNELFALLGPNGAGKTTLIHILCTILQPDSGTVTLAGFDVVRQPLKARRHLGVVFQEPSVDDRLTVFENLNFHGLVYQVPATTRRKRIGELLKLVELEDWRHALVRSLSSGMKRRVEIARAQIHDSAVLILDEPTSGLDAQSRERIWAYLMRLRRDRALTIIVTTHYIEEVEGCDRVCIIDHGHVLAEGNMSRAPTQALGRPGVGTWHARTLPVREPGGLTVDQRRLTVGAGRSRCGCRLATPSACVTSLIVNRTMVSPNVRQAFGHAPALVSK